MLRAPLVIFDVRLPRPVRRLILPAPDAVRLPLGSMERLGSFRRWGRRVLRAPRADVCCARPSLADVSNVLFVVIASCEPGIDGC